MRLALFLVGLSSRNRQCRLSQMTSIPKTEVGSTSKRRPSEGERRFAERFTFSAVAEIMNVGSPIRVSARVSDISRSGCYLDAINVFAQGTKIRLTICHANQQFDAAATVVYSLPDMGMGITFDSVDAEMSAVLDRWIAEVKGEIVPLGNHQMLSNMMSDYSRVERDVLGRLIGLMMRKNILARDEGADLLDELLCENQE
jgi:hypothetical protein